VSFLPRLYEPLFGRMLSGVRRAARELAPPFPGLLVLDIGCGTGAFLASYAAAGCRVAGLDASAEMLAAARRRLGPGAVLVRGDAGALPFPSGAAGLVTATMLFHSLTLTARGAALAEMARVAAPSGCVVVADHRPGAPAGLGKRGARFLAGAVEALAGHGAGVRSLRGAGGIAALAGVAGLVVDAVLPAAGGALEVVRLRRASGAA